MSLQFTLDFLKDLSSHNSKEWMDDNKKRYLEAKQNVIEVVARVIERAQTFDAGIVGIDPKKTLFRINRDIRFSKNKDPYKTNFGASIVEGGKKSGNPGYYLHIMPGNNFVGGGIYQPPSEALQKIRQEIDYNGKDLEKIIKKSEFSSIYPEPYVVEKLKSAPCGYAKDHEHLEYLQLKHFVYMRKVSDQEVTSDSFVDLIVNSYQALFPFNEFLKTALD